MNTSFELKNICIYPDGSLHPRRKHHNCSGKWGYDGQVFYHLMIPKAK